jgi:hypothetical protein
MKSTSIAFFTAVLISTAAHAASVDMKEPRRAVGREDDIRIDATLAQETVSANSAIGVTIQVEKIDVSYDAETRTIALVVGSEVPSATMPHLTLIAPGQKRAFTTGGITHLVMPRIRSPFVSTPNLVQIKVNVLRDVKPFAEVAVSQPISDALFDTWVEGNESIVLNPLPVRWKDGPRGVAERTSAEVARGSW